MDYAGVGSTNIIETTLGDLIEAVTQIALEAGKSEREGYELASKALENMLNSKPRPEEVF